MTKTRGPKLYPPIPRTEETDEDNVVRQEQAKGEVRPDGPGDETSPVKPERPEKPPRD